MKMQARLFEARIRQANGAAIIDLFGEINRASEDGLQAAYAAAAALGTVTLLLNFSQVDYINSTGIAVIVGVLARARKDGRTLTVFGLTEHYRTIFEITRLVDFMQVFPDEQSAIRGDVADLSRQV
jgi:anti-anti-sigma factor